MPSVNAAPGFRKDFDEILLVAQNFTDFD